MKWWILILVCAIALWAVFRAQHQAEVRANCTITQGHTADYCRMVGR